MRKIIISTLFALAATTALAATDESLEYRVEEAEICRITTEFLHHMEYADGTAFKHLSGAAKQVFKTDTNFITSNLKKYPNVFLGDPEVTGVRRMPFPKEGTKNKWDEGIYVHVRSNAANGAPSSTFFQYIMEGGVWKITGMLSVEIPAQSV